MPRGIRQEGERTSAVGTQQAEVVRATNSTMSHGSIQVDFAAIYH